MSDKDKARELWNQKVLNEKRPVVSANLSNRIRVETDEYSDGIIILETATGRQSSVRLSKDERGALQKWLKSSK